MSAVAALADPPRTRQGQFAPGHSGNPGGRPKGARNRMTLAAEALLEENGEGLIRKLIDDGLGGDRQALRFLVGRLCPANAEPAIALDLAPGKEGDLVHVHGLVVRAMMDGEITPKQALVVVRVLEVGAKLMRLRRRAAAAAKSPSPARGGGTGRGQSDAAEKATPVSDQHFESKSESAARPLPNPPPRAAEGEAAPVSRQYFSAGEAAPRAPAPVSGLRASTALGRPPVPDLYFRRAA